MPQVLLAQETATGLYNANLGPHVDRVTSTIGPYYKSVRDNGAYVHQTHIMPAMDFSRPHLHKAYASTQRFMLTTGLPYARHAWSNVIIFVDGTMFPLVKSLYSDNVKPQLVMIGERIAKYQESRKLNAVMDAAESSMESTVEASVTTSAASSDGTIVATTTTTTVEDGTTSTISPEKVSASASSSSEEPELATEESISEDLVKWQRKFAAAADKGTDDLRARVQTIVDNIVKSDMGEGEGLATALRKTADNEIDTFKLKIKSIVASLPEGASSSEYQKANQDVEHALRASGTPIRNMAQKMRDWAHRFQATVTQRSATASDSTLEVLDGIRDLGLQEIGMRWAWMEGVTYKHWAKYHDLKKQLDDWRGEVQAVAVRHPAAEKASEKAKQTLEESMAYMEDAVHELVRLRDVAKWKVRAHDTTDDFESRAMPAAVVSASSSVSSGVIGTTQSQGTIDSLLSQGSSAAGNAQSSVTSVVAGTDSGAPLVSQASVAVNDAYDSASSAAAGSTSSVESVLSQASSAVVGTSTGSIESVVSQASNSASSMVAGSSSGTSAQAISSVSSLASEKSDSVSSIASSVAASASSIVKSTVSPSDMGSSVSSIVDDSASTASSSVRSVPSRASSKLFAMAQGVPQASVPILDDQFDDSESARYSESLQSVINGAGDRYADVTKAVSEALYGTTQGTVESMTSVASDQYAGALAAASSAIYGSPQGTAESIASVATDKYSQAVSAASAAVYGTPTPAAGSIAQRASSLYADASSRALENYIHAKSIASQQVSGTPKPIHEQMFSSIESAYSGSLAQASGKLDAALSAASGSYSSLSSVASSAMPTRNSMGYVSSLASSRLQDALSAASAQYSSAKVAVGATPTPAHQQYLQQAQRQYYEAMG